VQGEPGGGRVDPGADDPDDAGLLQPADAVQGRGRGEPDEAGELDVGAVRVALQGGQQPDVNIFTGDALVLASLGFSAALTVAQARLLPGRDPVAVTAVQFLAAAFTALPVAAVTEGTPAAAGGPGTLPAAAGLGLVGTLAPSTLFAYGQARVSAEVAGAFINLEPLVGAAAGAVVFGDPVAMAQAAGGRASSRGSR
jgi:O-acetylserine/cysteine efflux transporter